MERLLVEAVVVGVLAPLLHRYLLGGRPSLIYTFAYASGALVASWMLAELELARTVAFLSLTQILILGGVMVLSSVITIKILERFGQI